MEEDKFQSSYLSLEGDLLNITWNFTGNVHKKESATIWYWDDATWVMSACFIIFGVSTWTTYRKVVIRTRGTIEF